jgi:hypothetical protein
LVVIDIIEIHKLVGYTHLHSPKNLGILQANTIPKPANLAGNPC